MHQASDTSSDLSFDLGVRASLVSSLGVATIDVIAPPFTDTDSDGMDDNWEMANGLIVGIDDSGGDDDGDSATNLEEFLALTNPQDPKSRLRITAITQLVGGELKIDFTSTPGRTYQLRFSPDLTAFADVDGAELTADSAESSFTVPPPTDPVGYHQIVIYGPG